jgi:hypothetical protein
MSTLDLSENERKINEYIARKSRFVSAREFEGNGKVLVFNSAKVNPNANGKFGPVIEYTVKELSGIERIVNASAVSLISGLQSRLKEKPTGTDVPLLVKKTGIGTDTKYVIEHANASSSSN